MQEDRKRRTEVVAPAWFPTFWAVVGSCVSVIIFVNRNETLHPTITVFTQVLTAGLCFGITNQLRVDQPVYMKNLLLFRDRSILYIITVGLWLNNGDFVATLEVGTTLHMVLSIWYSFVGYFTYVGMRFAFQNKTDDVERRFRYNLYAMVITLVTLAFVVVPPYSALKSSSLSVGYHMLWYTTIFFSYVYFSVYYKIDDVPWLYLFCATYWVLMCEYYISYVLCPFALLFIYYSMMRVERRKTGPSSSTAAAAPVPAPVIAPLSVPVQVDVEAPRARTNGTVSSSPPQLLSHDIWSLPSVPNVYDTTLPRSKPATNVNKSSWEPS